MCKECPGLTLAYINEQLEFIVHTLILGASDMPIKTQLEFMAKPHFRLCLTFGLFITILTQEFVFIKNQRKH